MLAVESCERVIMNMLLEGVLKQDFHYTSYSRISYVVAGPRANALKTDGVFISTQKLAVTRSLYFQTQRCSAEKRFYNPAMDTEMVQWNRGKEMAKNSLNWPLMVLKQRR